MVQDSCGVGCAGTLGVGGVVEKHQVLDGGVGTLQQLVLGPWARVLLCAMTPVGQGSAWQQLVLGPWARVLA